MKIILGYCGNGYCGCDSEDAFFYDDNATDLEIGEELYDWACDNAESFAHVHFGWDGEYTEEEWEEYIENHVDFSWEIVSYEEYVKWCDNWGYTPKQF